MKKVILLSSLIIASLTANATLTYYFYGAKVDGKGTNNMQSVSGWTLDADGTTPASLSPYDYWSANPEEEINLVFGKNTSYASCQITRTIDIANITWESDIPSSYKDVSLLRWTGTNSLNISNDLTFKARNDGSAYTARIVDARNASNTTIEAIYFDEGLEVNVGGNVTIESGASVQVGYIRGANYSHAGKTFTVGKSDDLSSGNVNITAGTNNSWLYMANTYKDASETNQNVLFAGKLNLTNSNTKTANVVLLAGYYKTETNAQAQSEYMSVFLKNDYNRRTFIKMDGINGTGNVYATNMKTYDNTVDAEVAYPLTVNLELNNTRSDSVFSGKIDLLDSTSDVKRAEDVTFNITKTGSKTQTIIASSASVSTVKINEGELALSNETGSFGDITLNNGVLSVAGMSTETDIGELTANSITWNGGTINISISDYAADLITVNDFNKGETDTFKFVFSEDEENGIVTDIEYLILNAESGSIDFDVNDFSAEIDGYNANFTIEDNQLFVSFTAVPEPATIAGIFGVLALAFAAYRRRK